jgi:hypothetical protein
VKTTWSPCSHRSRRFDHGIHTRTRKTTGGAKLNPIVPSERPEDVGVLGEFVLDVRCHYASGIGRGHAEPYRITDRELAADPIILVEPGTFGGDDHVHPEPALVEAALGPQLAQLFEGGRRQDGLIGPHDPAIVISLQRLSKAVHIIQGCVRRSRPRLRARAVSLSITHALEMMLSWEIVHAQSCMAWPVDLCALILC